MSENDFNHIFESFFRGTNSLGQQGSGLGLYICREIMRKMDGEVFAEKEKDGMGIVLVFR
ncbi:sensor histidine kinase [Blautia sp. RD014234]|nr:sensor histidine kinase [Blautia parvula]